MAFHYDSLNSANHKEAMAATGKFELLLGKRLRFDDLEDSPQQANGSDCGVFVCLLMRRLLHRLLSADKDKKVVMSLGGKTVLAAAGRKEILRIIEDFRKEGERRRSFVSRPPILGYLLKPE